MPADITQNTLTQETPGVFQPTDDFVPAESSGARRRGGFGALAHGNLMLLVVFLGGVGGIYALSLRAGPAPAAAQQSKVELQVDTVLSHLSVARKTRQEADRKDNAVIDTYRLEAKYRQIPASELQANPFAYIPAPQPEPAVKEQPESPVAVAPTALDAEREYAQALVEAKKLSLQTVLTGRDGTFAMISGNLLREGQDIRGWVVADIQPKVVTLSWRDKTFTLRLP